MSGIIQKASKLILPITKYSLKFDCFLFPIKTYFIVKFQSLFYWGGGHTKFIGGVHCFVHRGHTNSFIILESCSIRNFENPCCSPYRRPERSSGGQCPLPWLPHLFDGFGNCEWCCGRWGIAECSMPVTDPLGDTNPTSLQHHPPLPPDPLPTLIGFWLTFESTLYEAGLL